MQFNFFPLLDAGRCNLEYTITLLHVTEPFEDKIEQAIFKPPLSKQRVEYALQHIRASCALSLVYMLMYSLIMFKLI